MLGGRSIDRCDDVDSCELRDLLRASPLGEGERDRSRVVLVCLLSGVFPVGVDSPVGVCVVCVLMISVFAVLNMATIEGWLASFTGFFLDVLLLVSSPFLFRAFAGGVDGFGVCMGVFLPSSALPSLAARFFCRLFRSVFCVCVVGAADGVVGPLPAVSSSPSALAGVGSAGDSSSSAVVLGLGEFAVAEAAAQRSLLRPLLLFDALGLLSPLCCLSFFSSDLDLSGGGGGGGCR